MEGILRSEAASRSPTTVVRCASCHTLLDDEVWDTLELVQRIVAAEISKLLLRWPADECVEVRRCGSCGKGISARRPFSR
jgi:hypothetical protein